MLNEVLWAVLAIIAYVALQAGVDVRVTPQTASPAPVIAAPTPTPAPAANTPAPLDSARYEQGRQVYLSQYCGVCHILSAAGSRGVFGPAQDGIGSTAAERIADSRYTGSATTAEEYIRESILTPSIFIVGGGMSQQSMPSFGHLPAADIDALVYFLSRQY